MKLKTPQTGIFILLLCGILAACTGTPADDEPLPTLAHLPTLTPNNNPTVTAVPDAGTTPNDSSPAAPTDITPNPIVLPGALPPTMTATSVNDLGLDTFPDVLEVGTQITLKGTLTTTDTNSGTAILTNDIGQTVNLLVDPFTAMTANNQLVQITGTVEKQAGSVTNAVRVSEINMINGSSALATPTDVPIPGVPTTTP
ncbi:MAG: hypothetical protein GC179_12480 [Anaerolineaceae bacterium]|nr:hypothetical protein [Anaerolineaceae bacterium]